MDLKGKRVYVTRYGALGDQVHTSHIPHLLKNLGAAYVAFEYNNKGYPVFINNPYIDEHIHFEPSIPPLCYYPYSFVEKRHKEIKERNGYDVHINLQNSIERAYIAMEDMPEYFMSSAYRREKYGKLNYYDQVTTFAGFPEHIGMKGELYFTESEETTVKTIYENFYKDKFVFIANLSGTSKHKILYNGEAIVKDFLAKHPDAVCITMGDKTVKEHAEFSGERIVNKAGVYPFRQSMLMTKYANMVMGCESGLMVVSTLLGAPTLQMMTAASIKNHGGDFPNDYSLQAPCKCSPCHKGPYNYIGCPQFDYLGLKYPVCVKFDKDTVLNRMEEIYAKWKGAR